MKHNYQVIVGNVGTVYDGPMLKEALVHFKEYREQSKDGHGRASHETVTIMWNGEPWREYRPKLLTPTIAELARLISDLKKEIGDEYRASDDPDDDTPAMQITIGCSFDKSWSYQTGDNSYSGGAYGHPYWGVGTITRRCNARELAKEIIEDCVSQLT